MKRVGERMPNDLDHVRDGRTCVLRTRLYERPPGAIQRRAAAAIAALFFENRTSREFA